MELIKYYRLANDLVVITRPLKDTYGDDYGLF